MLSIAEAKFPMLLQDTGRRLAAHLGVIPSLPLDYRALAWSNKLLGNAAHCPALAIALGGARFVAQADMMLASSGAQMPMTIEGNPIAVGSSFWLPKGSSLQLGMANAGQWLYLAVAGGWQSPEQLASVQPLPGQLQNLQQGAVLQAGPQRKQPIRIQPRSQLADYHQPVELPVVLEPSAQAQQFCAQAWQLSSQANAMGLRLQGQALPALPRVVRSRSVMPGLIQLPDSGLPIILGPRAGTMGGYPVLGQVSPLGLSKLAQSSAGRWLRFTAVTSQQMAQQDAVFWSWFDQA